jgi:hypothetical protein
LTEIGRYDDGKGGSYVRTYPQEQQALDDCAEPRLIDPRTKKAYVLVDADLFGRLRGLVVGDEGLEMHQVAVLVEQAMRDDDVNDPTLEFYQQKYGRKK